MWMIRLLNLGTVGNPGFFYLDCLPPGAQLVGKVQCTGGFTDEYLPVPLLATKGVFLAA